MVPNRARRQNAGRNMQQLIQQQLNKEGDSDEFYAGVYGGFQEVFNLNFWRFYALAEISTDINIDEILILNR